MIVPWEIFGSTDTRYSPPPNEGSSAMHASKKRNVSLGAMLNAVKKENATSGNDAHDELEEYLASPDVDDIDDFDDRHVFL